MFCSSSQPQFCWFCVFALGDGEYGCKTLVAQACEYHETAQCHPHNFEPPRVVFLFSGQVVPMISAALDAVHVCSESMDRVVHGNSMLFDQSNSELEIPSSVSAEHGQTHSANGWF